MMSGCVYLRSMSSCLVLAKCFLLPITRRPSTLRLSLITIIGTAPKLSLPLSPTPGLPELAFSAHMRMIMGMVVISNGLGFSSLTSCPAPLIRMVNRVQHGFGLGECEAPMSRSPGFVYCLSYPAVAGRSLRFVRCSLNSVVHGLRSVL